MDNNLSTSLANDIAAGLKAFEQSDAYKDLIQSKIKKLIEEALDEAIGWRSDFNKQIKAAIQKSMLEHAKPLFKEFYDLGIKHAQTPEHLVLDAPARVGGTVFRKGVSMLSVITAAQAHYEYSSKEQPKPIISAADMLRVAAGELVLVPVNPTPKMIDATWDHDEEVQSMSHNARNEFIYKKMIEAWEKNHE